MRTFIRIADADGVGRAEVWTGTDWQPIGLSPFDWEAHGVEFNEEPELRNVLAISRGRMPGDASASTKVLGIDLPLSLLPAVAEILPKLVGEADGEVSLWFTDGIRIDGMAVADLADFAATGKLAPRFFELLDRHYDRLVAVVSELGELANSDRLRIFGSAATDKELPGDIDVFADTGGMSKDEIRDLSVALVRTAGRHYGYLDPFLLVAGKLHCRNDNATGWQLAKNAAGILADGEAGVPLSEFTLRQRPLARYRDNAVSGPAHPPAPGR